MGDDDYRSRFEHVYKFVSRRPYAKGGGYKENQNILDEGTLYAAKFNADGSGEWIELVHGRNGLVADKGFASQAEVVIDARTAGDVVGATYMDRPEWIARHPRSQRGLRLATNNTSRGTGQPLGASDRSAPTGQPPRAERHGTHHALARGSAAIPRPPASPGTCSCWRAPGARRSPIKRGNVKGGGVRTARRLPHRCARGAVDPDRLVGRRTWCTPTGPDPRQQPDGRCGSGDRRGAAFPHRPSRLRSDRGAADADLRTMFVNIQHPGEAPPPQSRAATIRRSQGHQFVARRQPPAAVPRSATIAYVALDGGIVGADVSRLRAGTSAGRTAPPGALAEAFSAWQPSMLNGFSSGLCVSSGHSACSTALPITPASSLMCVQPAVRPNSRMVSR